MSDGWEFVPEEEADNGMAIEYASAYFRALKEEPMSKRKLYAGCRVRLLPDWADKDPDEVFELVEYDPDTGRGRIEDGHGRGWGVRNYQLEIVDEDDEEDEDE